MTQGSSVSVKPNLSCSETIGNVKLTESFSEIFPYGILFHKGTTIHSHHNIIAIILGGERQSEMSNTNNV